MASPLREAADLLAARIDAAAADGATGDCDAGAAIVCSGFDLDPRELSAMSHNWAQSVLAAIATGAINPVCAIASVLQLGVAIGVKTGEIQRTRAGAERGA